MLPHSQTRKQERALCQTHIHLSHVSERNVRHREELELFTRTISHVVLPFYHLALRCTSGLEPAPRPNLTIMEFLPPTQLDSAIALQTLALPMTLLLCITSMLRERSINQQDEKRLVRLYKQHAFMFELVQFFVALMACGFVAGNTIAALEARSLVIGFAGEDVTAMIVRSAISRNVWLAASAWCVLACVSMLDSWSLPGSLEDLTEPMFRLTREVVRGCEYPLYSFILEDQLIFIPDIWRHNQDETLTYDDDKPLSYDVEQPRPPPTTAIPSKEASAVEPLETPSTKPVNSTNTQNPPSPPPTAPPTPSEEKDTCFPNLHALISKAQSQSDSQPQPQPSAQISTTTTQHPPPSHPRYQNQTLTSALRATPKSPKARSRQRSVTFDLKGESVKQGKRESKAVKDSKQGDSKEEKEEGKSERLSSSVTSSLSLPSERQVDEDGGLAQSEAEDELLKVVRECRERFEREWESRDIV
jgi:hypothetical protein